MLARAGGVQAFATHPPAPVLVSPPTTYHLPPTVFTILPFAPTFRSRKAGFGPLASGVVSRPAYVNYSRLLHFQPRVKG